MGGLGSEGVMVVGREVVGKSPKNPPEKFAQQGCRHELGFVVEIVSF